MNPQLTRQARRLYVGNLPVGMGLTDQILTQFFSSTVTSLGITTPHPVLSVWLSAEQTFCFVEFRSVQDTNLCLQLLQGISLGNRTLRIGRPSEYAELPEHLKDYVVPLAQVPALSTMPNPLNPAAGLDPSLGLIGMGPVLPILPTFTPESKALSLENMLTEEDYADDEEYDDIVADITEECEQFGKVIGVVVPRKKGAPGFLRAYILFDSVESCKGSRSKLNGKLFNGRQVKATFFDESKFMKKDFL